MPYPRQKIELVGNLGRDAEMRYMTDGTPVTTFQMAVTREWRQNDETKKETMWVNCSAFNKLAEAITNLKKGQQVLVIGYFKPDKATGSPRTWAKKDGSPGSSYELTAQEVWLSVFGSQSSGAAGQHETQSAGEFAGAPDDDIPF